MTAVLRAIRGATTLDEDTKDQVYERTQALVREILARNELAIDDLVSIVFTVTGDVHAAFPATAARALGLDDVALLGAQEIAVPGALERCIRVLVHCYSERDRSELRHVYLEGATVLRRDLVP
ncbi:MAG: chorismate mutase [Actinomycetota bacterium]|jgi:chorismate mutase|nr:chorismate mutase [Actinomycetota bacterium]